MRPDDRLPKAGTAAVAEGDPLEGDARLPGLFGGSWEKIEQFHGMLARDGVLRGLVGPREVSRLWERHLVNSAAVVPFIPDRGLIVDVGSGAGLPGVVIAAMRPEAEVVLLEPMERRTAWLTEVASSLGLRNVEVLRGRAEDQRLEADVVTARAVAALDKLYGWTLPLVKTGGRLVALKGGRAAEEIRDAAGIGEALGGGEAEIHTAPTLEGLDPTTVVVMIKAHDVPTSQSMLVPRETARPRRAPAARRGRRR